MRLLTLEMSWGFDETAVTTVNAVADHDSAEGSASTSGSLL